MLAFTKIASLMVISIFADISAEPVELIDGSVSFRLYSSAVNTKSFTYRAPQDTRFALVAAHSDTGIIELSVTRAGWLMNSTVSKDPGMSIEFGYDGSSRQNPSGGGSCNKEVIGWDAPFTNFTEITITVSTFTLYAIDRDAAYATNVMLSVTPYGITAPIPGGCCSTCLTSNTDASLVVRDKGAFDSTIVFSQSNLASDKWDWQMCACDAVANENQAQIIEYQLYFYFVGSCGSAYRHSISQNAVNEALGRMSTVEGVLKHGTRLSGLPLYPVHLNEFFHIDATAGQGVIYTVLVKDNRAEQLNPGLDSTKFMATYAAYPTFRCRIHGQIDAMGRSSDINCSSIPSRTDCDIFPECVWEFDGPRGYCTLDAELQPCDDLLNIEALVLNILLGIAGAVVAFAGHRYYKTQLFIDGTLLFGAVAYVGLAYNMPNLSDSEHQWVSIGCGVAGGLLSLYTWWFSRGVTLSIIITGALCGLVLTGFVFATPFGEYRLWQNSFNFGMAAVCGILVPPIFIMIWDRLLAIAGSACTGAYLLLVAVDFFVASSFDDMVINVLRRVTSEQFGKDYSGNIFASEFNGCSNVEINVAMLAAWTGLTAIAMFFQLRVMSRLPRGAPSGAGGPLVSDRIDGEYFPMEITYCLCPCQMRRFRSGRRTRTRSGRRGHSNDVDDNEDWGIEDAQPLVDVSGSNGFSRASVSSWGSWSWSRRRSVSPSSPRSPVSRPASASTEHCPLLPDSTAPSQRRGSSSQTTIYHDDSNFTSASINHTGSQHIYE